MTRRPRALAARVAQERGRLRAAIIRAAARENKAALPAGKANSAA
jgi:hypothetical protein